MNNLRFGIVAGVVCLALSHGKADAGIRHQVINHKDYLVWSDKFVDVNSDGAIRNFLETATKPGSSSFNQYFWGELSREEEIKLIQERLLGPNKRSKVNVHDVTAFLWMQSLSRKENSWGATLRPYGAGVISVGLFLAASYGVDWGEGKLSSVRWLAGAVAGLFAAVTFSVVNSIVEPSTAVVGQWSYMLAGTNQMDVSTKDQKQLAAFYKEQFWRTNRSKSWLEEEGAEKLDRVNKFLNVELTGIGQDYNNKLCRAILASNRERNSVFFGNTEALEKEEKDCLREEENWLVERISLMMVKYKILHSLDVPLLSMFSKTVSIRLKEYDSILLRIKNLSTRLLESNKKMEEEFIPNENFDTSSIDEDYYLKMQSAWLPFLEEAELSSDIPTKMGESGENHGFEIIINSGQYSEDSNEFI